MNEPITIVFSRFMQNMERDRIIDEQESAYGLHTNVGFGGKHEDREEPEGHVRIWGKKGREE